MVEVEIPLPVRKILTTVTKNNHEIYIVGGIVRDLLLKKKGLDWDFTTSAKPKIINALFKDSFYDNKFGTVGVPDPNNRKGFLGRPLVYEITTFRTESSYSNQRHPDKVKWGKTLKQDLLRRDFTVNAIALKPKIPSKPLKTKIWPMEIFDPLEGQKDLKAKLLRAVGNPQKRLEEDALRLIRAVRLATQLEFEIEAKTLLAIKKNASSIKKISWERIRDEFLKMLAFPHADQGYSLLRQAGIAKIILPEVEKGFGIEQKSPNRHHIYDVGTHATYSLKHCKSKDPIVKLAALIHDVGKPEVASKDPSGTITFYNHEMVGAVVARNVGKRFKLPKKGQERLIKLVRWHQFSVDERQTDKAIRRFIRNVGQENLKDILCVRIADRLGGGAKETSWRLERFKKKLIEVQKQPFSVKDLKVNGDDIMKALNLKPGPLIGQVLNKLFEEIEEDQKNNQRTYLLKRAREIKQTLADSIN